MAIPIVEMRQRHRRLRDRSDTGAQSGLMYAQIPRGLRNTHPAFLDQLVALVVGTLACLSIYVFASFALIVVAGIAFAGPSAVGRLWKDWLVFMGAYFLKGFGFGIPAEGITAPSSGLFITRHCSMLHGCGSSSPPVGRFDFSPGLIPAGRDSNGFSISRIIHSNLSESWPV